jgi:hypothetical protein
MRGMIEMIERGEVWVKGFQTSLEYDGDMELKISIGGVGAKTETMRTINGTMIPVTTQGPAPSASALINGLYQAANGGVAAGPPAINPWMPETWNLTEQGKILRQDRAAAERMARAAKSYVGATKANTFSPAPGQTAINGGGYIVDPMTKESRPNPLAVPSVAEQTKRIRSEIEAALAVARLKELELAEAEKLQRPKVPEGTRDLDLDI